MPIPLLMKGQLQIGESMMVILILMILGVIALVFYFNMATEDYVIQAREFEDLNTLETAQIVSNLYELKCAKPGVNDVCFDIHKVRAVAELRDDDSNPNQAMFKNYYRYLFSDSKVALKQYYPVEEDEFVIYEQDAREVGEFGVNPQTANHLVMPVIIHDSAQDSNGFGVLTIDRYFRP